MLLLLDIGNTAVTYGVSDGKKIIKAGSCLYNEIPALLRHFEPKARNLRGLTPEISRSRFAGRRNDDIVISSVVPKVTQKLKKQFGKTARIWIAGENLPIPVKHRYRSPKKLGKDRLVNIFGALRMYKAPLVVIDYGTAITFDYVSAAGVFEGGMIVPGPEVSFQALIQRAALLPKKIRLPKKAGAFLGKDTLECMKSGILQGYGALTDDLVSRFKSRYGKNLKVIATGGFAGHLKPYVSSFNIEDPRHSMKALLLLYKEAS